MQAAIKVIILGHCFGTSGWAQHTRYFSTALSSLLEVDVIPWDFPLTITDTALNSHLERASLQPADVGIGIGPIERMEEIPCKYRIGFIVWETTIIPQRKLSVLHKLDEIWVPSTWGQKILINNGLPRECVFVIPEGVDAAVFRPSRIEEQDSQSVVRFLSVGKWENRKGISSLIRAFSLEFAPDEPVELILHCFNPYLPNFDMEHEIRQLSLPEHAPIRPSFPVSRGALIDLYNQCAVFVLPTKAEGWGLPIIEAMACGLPVIATNYSAHTDFLNNNNGYLIDVAKMIPVNDPFFYGTGESLGLWAEPNFDHLRQLLRRTFQESAERKTKGHQARKDIINHWTWQNAAQVAYQRLQAL